MRMTCTGGIKWNQNWFDILSLALIPALSNNRNPHRIIVCNVRSQSEIKLWFHHFPVFYCNARGISLDNFPSARNFFSVPRGPRMNYYDNIFSLQFRRKHSASSSPQPSSLAASLLIPSAPTRFSHDLLSSISALRRIIEAHTQGFTGFGLGPRFAFRAQTTRNQEAS